MRLTVGRATLALAVIAMIISSDQRRVDIHGVRDGFAEAVSGDRHDEGILARYLRLRTSGEGRRGYLRTTPLPLHGH